MPRIEFAFVLLANLLRVLVGRLIRRGAASPLGIGQQALVLTMRRHGLRLMAMDPARARRRSNALQQVSPPPRGVRITEVRLGEIDALRFEPPDGASKVELLYFHGGGYAFGSPYTYRAHLGRLARAIGGRVTAPKYRLAPEHRFPAAVDDAIGAHRAMVADVGAERLIVAGDSAGGALAIAALLAARGRSEPLAAAAILISPWCDLSAAGGSIVSNANADWGDGAYLSHWSRLYLGDADARDPRASPLHADLRGLPPLRVLVGGGELLRDQAAQLVDAAAAAGVDAKLETWPDMVHAFWMLAPVFPGDAALARVAEWTRAI